VNSADELLAASGEVARSLAGAEHSAWNGQVVETDGVILGLAHWDGTLYLDREGILDPLREMYERAGEDQPEPVLVRYRESLATLLHEHSHFIGPSGSSQEAAHEAFTRPGSRQLEEGVTEAWAQDHLNEYIRRLGVDKVAPGIESVQNTGYYAAFVPAVRRITDDLETRNNLPKGQVLDNLNRQNAVGQFPLLVGLVYNSTRLPDLEPAGGDTRGRIESILRSGLAYLDAFELTATGFATAKSHSTAGYLLDHLNHEIQSAECAYTFRPDNCVLPSPTHTALSGVAPLSSVAPPSRVTSASGVTSPFGVATPARSLPTRASGRQPPSCQRITC
jgi:hypothetical protein